MRGLSVATAQQFLEELVALPEKLRATLAVQDEIRQKIVTALKDEKGRDVHSEKMVELHFRAGVPLRNGDQFGVGRIR